MATHDAPVPSPYEDQLQKAMVSLAVVFAQALGRGDRGLRNRLEGAATTEFQRLNHEGDTLAAGVVFQLLREIHEQNLDDRS